MISVDHFRCPCLKIESVVKVSTTILISSTVLCLRATVSDNEKKLLNNEKKLLKGWKTIHDGRLLGLFLPQLRKFNFWLTEQYFIFQMKQDIKTS